MSNLQAIVWRAVRALEETDKAGASKALSEVREELASRGLGKNPHVGRKDLDPEAVIEWYAGQGLEIIDNEKWFAVNSWINCAERFLGPDPQTKESEHPGELQT